MSGTPIEFWFDFASGYAYFAARDIDALGARVGRSVLWRPFLLGTAFRATGVKGLSSTPLKKDYAWRDWDRMARRRAIPFALPPHHPSVALAATRAFYAIAADDGDGAVRFARAILDAYFIDGIDSGDAEQVLGVAGRLGWNVDRLRAAIADPALKARVKETSEGAVARGIFGSPFFLVDGEPFWGVDRMGMMEDWIRSGGW